jgi:hypothetical protein
VGFIFLASGVRFDSTNEEGLLLHKKTGMCVNLDPIATLLLEISLESETKAQAVASLSARLDATEAQLEEALEATLDHLLTHRFLSTIAPSEGGCDEVGPVQSPAFDVMIHQPVPQRCGREHIDWEFFLTGRLLNRPLPRFSCARRGYALFQTGTVLCFVGMIHLIASLCELSGASRLTEKVRQQAWEALAHHLSRLGHNGNIVEEDDAMRVARRELVFCQMLVRLLAPTAVCLIRSTAFCTYLRALGLPAFVVIGRARFDLTSQYAFHAWTELEGQVVNDHAELQSGYAEISRIPSQEQAETTTRRSFMEGLPISSVLLAVLLLLLVHVGKRKR